MPSQFSQPGDLPYPELGDENNPPADFQRLTDRIAELLDGYTTTERDAFAGDDLWAGRRIWNVTTGRVEVYNGTAWVPVGVTDHAALSNLTAGDPHTQYVRKSTLTAKGDLFVATGSGVIVRLPAGANGQALLADSAQTTGLRWATIGGGGGGGVSDHGLLTGLADDDHPSYVKVDGTRPGIVLSRGLSADHTLELTDAGKVLECGPTVAIQTITIPANADVAFPVGTLIELVHTNSFAVLIEPDIGVTLYSFDDLRELAGTNAAAVLRKSGTDTWYLEGRLI